MGKLGMEGIAWTSKMCSVKPRHRKLTHSITPSPEQVAIWLVTVDGNL